MNRYVVIAAVVLLVAAVAWLAFGLVMALLTRD
jgi:hypothetical protein